MSDVEKNAEDKAPASAAEAAKVTAPLSAEPAVEALPPHAPEAAPVAPAQPAAVEPAPVAPAPKPAEPVAPAPVAAAPSPQVTPETRAKPEPAPSLFRRRTGLQSPQQTLQPEAPPAPPPPRKKRRDGTLSAVSGFLSFLLLLLIAGAFGLIAAMHKLKEPGPLPAEKTVYIPPRSDTPEILAQLERENVIDSPALMNVALLVEGARSKLRPGEYLFKQNVSLREVIDELVSGRQVLHSVTIPEGLTSEQIVQRLRDSDALDGDIKETPKEGSLLPETYRVARGFPRSKLIAKMQEDQRKLVEQIWARRARDLPVKTPFELVTLASIVEKETGLAAERPHVASVFVNRLRKGMRLQSDPTIVYGLVGGKATLGRGILRSELERWTAYNTYAIDGLPPGPIANPGKAALEAVANPSNTRDLYFVADGTGGHVFAESLDAHNRNVQRWRQHERDLKAPPPAGEPDHAAPGAAPAPPPRDQRGELRYIGRVVALVERHEDYPAGRAMAADDGATHRIGKFGPQIALGLIDASEDPTESARAELAPLRPARPFFTDPAAQPVHPAVKAGPDLLASAPGFGEEQAAGSDALAPESADGKAIGVALGGEGAAEAASVATYPVPPTSRADQKARAARLGLSSGSDKVPTEALEDRPQAAGDAPRPLADTARPVADAQAYAGAPRPARPRAFDASEGTSLDPLRDKSWDLTSAKTVPSAASYR